MFSKFDNRSMHSNIKANSTTLELTAKRTFFLGYTLVRRIKHTLTTSFYII